MEVLLGSRCLSLIPSPQLILPTRMYSKNYLSYSLGEGNQRYLQQSSSQHSLCSRRKRGRGMGARTRESPQTPIFLPRSSFLSPSPFTPPTQATEVYRELSNEYTMWVLFRFTTCIIPNQWIVFVCMV